VPKLSSKLSLHPNQATEKKWEGLEKRVGGEGKTTTP